MGVKEGRMPEFVIERGMPDVGSLSADQLRDAAHQSNQVIRGLGPEIR